MIHDAPCMENIALENDKGHDGNCTYLPYLVIPLYPGLWWNSLDFQEKTRKVLASVCDWRVLQLLFLNAYVDVLPHLWPWPSKSQF